MPFMVARGRIDLRNIITKTDFDCFSIYFSGKDCFTGETIEAYMNKWKSPIPIYEPNQKEPLNGMEYEGMEVEGLVRFTTKYSAKGNLCYNVDSVQIDSTEVKRTNPFMEMNPFLLNRAESHSEDDYSDEEELADSYEIEEPNIESVDD